MEDDIMKKLTEALLIATMWFSLDISGVEHYGREQTV